MLFSALFHLQLSFLFVLLVSAGVVRSSQISDLKSKLSGVEELLEEFRKQLQQDDSYQSAEEASDACLSDYEAAEERIIRAMASIERGATFLSAPGRVYSRRDCVRACCAEPRCTTAIVQEQSQQPDSSVGLRCYLFNCTYGGANVCAFSFQRSFSTFSRVARNVSASIERQRRPVEEDEESDSSMRELDEPPRSDAGMDVVIQLPTDWAILDGRDSMDDHGVVRYEWTLVKGDPSVSMKVTHPGLLKLTGLTEGVYTFQMTVTDTIGQRSSDNVSVTVLAPEHHAKVCTHHCSPYQFMCDDGCCIDISYACDGKQHCPDRSDEDFCRNFDGGRKAVTHAASAPSQNVGAREAEGRAMIPSSPRNSETPVEPKQPKQPTADQGVFPRWYYDPTAGECKHFLYSGCKGNHNNFLQQADCANECIQKPGTVMALVVGVMVSALLLLMVGCRLRVRRHRRKKALPLTTEESDYLINGMYL
ncbi:Low-density lipoprotein receptor-related protein 11 [Bagarius yarrelli]|uniref:Low-density lipoprotein receptor-related protein 11 n=1 Tax=Bagarius yarrelli TaxID=175774 RepID=A0A556TZE7_BAGYA|nr:Low-density lipoprotein receptor-related protein 11 [Bagarius yarrelli]